jgi:hypothetical protein
MPAITTGRPELDAERAMSAAAEIVSSAGTGDGDASQPGFAIALSAISSIANVATSPS